MCKALSFVDACTEEHFAAMSRSWPPPRRRGRLIHSLNEVCL